MPDKLARAVIPNEMRERDLKLGIAPHQRIIVRVGNLRRILGVIATVVMRNGLGKAHQLVGGFSFGSRHHTPSSKRSACALASGVTSAPDSMRAISSCRPA